MAKFNYIAILFTGLLGTALAGPSFFLRAHPYGSSDEIQQESPLYLTRHGFLTDEKDDADTYSLTNKAELVTFTGRARSQKMGIISNNTEPTPLTSISPRLHSSKRITSNFTLSSRFDDDDHETQILSFENTSFKNSQKEAAFVMLKNEEGNLAGEKLLVVTTYKSFDWSKVVLVDLVIDYEKSGDEGDGSHEEM